MDEEKLIAGIDEVGRGCLFGPVVACSVIMPKDRIEGIKDSKKLSPKKREELDREIRKRALAIGFGRVEADEIDRINIKEAARSAMKKAVLSMKNGLGEEVRPDGLLIDAEELDLDIPQESIIHGDDLVYEISCASILAKVYRDSLFKKYEEEYPGYSLITNKGYGTKKHYQGLDLLGPTDQHRKTFLKKWREYEKKGD